MARMNNTKKAPERTTMINHEGTETYSTTSLENLLSKVLGSFFGESTYYDNRDAEGDYKKVVKLIEQVPERDKEYILKIAELGRNCNMISYPLALLTACYNDDRFKGESFIDERTHRNKLFTYTNSIVRRALDVTEILSMQMSMYPFEKKKSSTKNNQRNRQYPLPMQMRKGLKAKIEKFDTFKLSKGLAEGKEVSLADAIKLLRPIPCNYQMEKTYKSIIEGNLSTGAGKTQIKSAVSQKGQQADKTNKDLKSAVFNGTVQNILYSLNTLINEEVFEDSKVLYHVDALFRDKKAITKSKLLPFRFLTAYFEVASSYTSPKVRDVLLEAVSYALDLSIDNLDVIEGYSAILVDVSGSMSHKVSDNSKSTAMDIAMVLGAIAYKKGYGDLYLFANSCEKVDHMPRTTPIIQMVSSMKQIARGLGGGTYLNIAFDKITAYAQKNKLTYDNLILLTDGDCYGYDKYSNSFVLNNPWMSYGNPEEQINRMLKTGVVNKFWLNNLLGNDFVLVNMNGNVKNLVTGFSEKFITMINTYNMMGGSKDIKKLIDMMLEQTRPA